MSPALDEPSAFTPARLTSQSRQHCAKASCAGQREHAQRHEAQRRSGHRKTAAETVRDFLRCRLDHGITPLNLSTKRKRVTSG